MNSERTGHWQRLMTIYPITIDAKFLLRGPSSTSRFVQWMHAKYTNPHLIQRRQFIKCHLMVGVKTSIVTAVEMTEGFEADSPKFQALVETTGKNFVMQEVSADKAYLSAKNLQVVVDHHAQPYIPFKTNSKSNKPSHAQPPI